jgi:hypothetical protein
LFAIFRSAKTVSKSRFGSTNSISSTIPRSYELKVIWGHQHTNGDLEAEGLAVK